MKIKSTEYWKLQDELGSLRAEAQAHGNRIAVLTREKQEWRSKFEALQAGGPEKQADLEAAIERGRQLGLRQVRSPLVDAIQSASKIEAASREFATQFSAMFDVVLDDAVAATAV